MTRQQIARGDELGSVCSSTPEPFMSSPRSVQVADALPGLSIDLYFSMPLLYILLIVALKAYPRTTVAAQDVS